MPTRFVCLVLCLMATGGARAQTSEPDAIARAGLAPSAPDDLVLAATPCVNGFAGVYACSGIDLAARMPLSTFTPTAPTSLSEIWGWTDPTTGREIALVGLSNGIGFVDVTVPASPVYLGKLPSATAGQNDWRIVREGGGWLYASSEASGHGVQIFSLARLRGVTTPQTFTADARYTRVSNVHTLSVLNGYLYLAGATSTVGATNATCTSGGIHVVDVRNPAAPVYAGCYTGDGYTHETQCLTYTGPDADYVGRDLCFAYQGQEGSNFLGEMTVVDMTNKAAPVRISTANYPDVGYSHQGWLTADGRHILINDELDESAQGVRTVVMDTADLDDIGFAYNAYGAIATYAHNIFVKGRYAYESNYTQGLRIVDTQNVGAGQLTEVARFDTYNQDNCRTESCGYEGQWMNYPYFASGTVIASDINNGLFVLRPTALAVAGEAAAPDAATGLALSEPAPNPTRDAARLSFTTGAPQHVRATLVDALGREVAVLFDGTADGTTTLDVRRDGRPAGTYVVRVAGERTAATRRIVFTR